MITLDLQGFEQLAARLDAAGAAVATAVDHAVEASALDYQNTVRERTPVDTGHLRNGWTVRVLGEAEREVFNPVVYALRRNYGFAGTDSLGRTYNEPGAFFAEHAADDVRPRFIERLRQALGEVLE